MITFIILVVIAMVIETAVDKYGDLKSWADSAEE